MSQQHRPDLAADFRMAMRAFAATVTVVTVSDGVRRHGMTASSVTSLSMDPPSLLMCVNQSTLLHDILFQARWFTINILACDQQDIASAFAGRVPPEDRFEVGEWVTDGNGVPRLVDAQATLACRKAAAIPFGTHTILVGALEEIRVRPAVPPLIYQDGRFCVAGAAESAVALG